MEELRRFHRVGVAFSGGVDSTLLLYAAREVLEHTNVFVLRAVSELLPQAEVEYGDKILDEMGVLCSQRIDVACSPLLLPEFVVNDQRRCYHCKHFIYTAFLGVLNGRECQVLLDGTNSDDLTKERPGRQAVTELAVKTPLADSGLVKREIRFLARCFSLSNYNKQSNSCLATRIPFGTSLCVEQMVQINRYEDFLRHHGFSGHRVRPEGRNVVVVLADSEAILLQNAAVHSEIIQFFLNHGFENVSFKMIQRD